MKSKGIFKPEGGWESHTWYVGKCRMNKYNPAFKVLIYSGFLINGKPGGYSGVFSSNCCPTSRSDNIGWEVEDCYYLRPEKVIHYNKVIPNKESIKYGYYRRNED